MCSFLASTLVLLLRLQHINFYLKFRGPDYTGTHAYGGFTFVHNLLHMTGEFLPQPFLGSHNSTVALFNGEIYNFRELQRLLRPSGPPYRSDGECILEAYAKWGTTFGRHFRGEFAVAVFDLRAQRIIVVSDPFGVKPLFIARTTNSFGVSSYRSGLVRAGHSPESIFQLTANHVHVYSYDVSEHSLAPHNFALTRTRELVRWDLHQYVLGGDAWAAAFEEAVRVRTEGAFRGVFLALSSGYDSGAIHLAMLRLGVPHATYSIIGAENKHDQRLLRRRIAFAKNYSPTQGGGPSKQSLSHYIFHVNQSQFQETYKRLQRSCEPYRYEIPVFSKPEMRDRPKFVLGELLTTDTYPLLKDSAAMGVAAICSMAKAQGGQLVMLTGSGADETMSDYGFNGLRFAAHSQFGGFFPNDTALQHIFPWADFYGGSQRAYLAKDEYVTGAYGIEGRFPFLDTAVVQAGLSLSQALKNKYYKAGSQLYMAKYGYPHESCIADADHPFGGGPGCKKVGFLVPKRPRRKGATSGCNGPACRPYFR